MMVVDASALAAVFFLEPDAPKFLRALQQRPYACMSAANFLEIAIVIDNRDAPEQMVDLDLFLAEAGVEIVPVTAGQARIARDAYRKEVARRIGSDREKIRAEMARWDAANPGPRATLKDVADHIDHARSVCGIDCIGVGGDFDGMSEAPEGLEDVSKYVDLLVELKRRGYSDADLKKIAGENLLRVFREVEKVAAQIRASEAK